jgi:hypothetical protein
VVLGNELEVDRVTTVNTANGSGVERKSVVETNENVEGGGLDNGSTRKDSNSGGETHFDRYRDQAGEFKLVA